MFNGPSEELSESLSAFPNIIQCVEFHLERSIRVTFLFEGNTILQTLFFASDYQA